MKIKTLRLKRWTAFAAIAIVAFLIAIVELGPGIREFARLSTDEAASSPAGYAVAVPAGVFQLVAPSS